MVSSYNGWTASRDPSAIGVNSRWEPIPGHRFPGGIKSGDVETVFTYLVRQLDARVEPIEDYPPGDEWGYNYRPNVNNPSSLSCHASATAIDYNATQHPNKVKYTWTQEQTREIHKILDECSGVIRWLEGYDEMHFEIRGTQAQVAAAAKKIREMAAPTPPDNVPPEIEKAKKEGTPMLVIRQENRDQQLFLNDGATIVAHKPLMSATPTTPSVEVDNVMWNFLIDFAKYTKTFIDPRPKT